jgi:hypothetical protein
MLHAYLAETSRIVNFELPQDGWSELGKLAVSRDQNARIYLISAPRQTRRGG